MAARIFKRGNIWYAWVATRAGGTRKVSTKCTDRRAAESRAAELERSELDPDGEAQKAATLQDVLELLIRDRAARANAGEGSAATVEFYRKKAGALVAGLAEVLERSPRAAIYLREIDGGLVDDYVTMRREGGAVDATIAKELVAWKQGMKIARRRRWWIGDLDEVFPQFSGASSAVSRWVTPEEFGKLFAAIVRTHGVRTPALDETTRAEIRRRYHAGERAEDLAARFGVSRATLGRYVRKDEAKAERDVKGHDLFAAICFSIATSAEWSALWRARASDIAEDLRRVVVRGSKNENRKDRSVPVEFFPFALMLAFVERHMSGPALDGGDRMLFRPSMAANFRTRLREACARAGIAPLSPNDLRRSHAKWLRLAGVAPSVIFPNMGHVDSRMVELRYGKASADELAAVQRAQLTNATWVADAVGSEASRPGGLLMGGASGGSGDSGPVLAATSPKNPAETGAWGRNRTADTGIFNPPVDDPSTPADTDGSGHSPSRTPAKPTSWAANGRAGRDTGTAAEKPEKHGGVSSDPPRERPPPLGEGHGDGARPGVARAASRTAEERSSRRAGGRR